MPTIHIDIEMPEDIFSALRRSPDEFARDMRLAVAMQFYEQGEISQEKAAQIAGLNRRDFLWELAMRKKDVFIVDFDDLKRELARE